MLKNILEHRFLIEASSPRVSCENSILWACRIIHLNRSVRHWYTHKLTCKLQDVPSVFSQSHTLKVTRWVVEWDRLLLQSTKNFRKKKKLVCKNLTYFAAHCYSTVREKTVKLPVQCRVYIYRSKVWAMMNMYHPYDKLNLRKKHPWLHLDFYKTCFA